MIERDPHGWFAGAWAGWLACVFYALARPDEPALGLTVLLAFLPLEGAGIMWRTRFRDTLSEIVTWIVKTLSKHDRAFRGWNNLVWLIAFPVAWLFGRTVLHYSGSWPLAVGMSVPLLVMLHDHWLNPKSNG
jgi:hypothetical protein